MMRGTVVTFVTLLCLLSPVTLPAAPVEIEVGYGTIEKMLVEKVFVQQGRKFLFGSPDSPCMYGHLSAPKVSGEEGRIRMQTLFEGSLAELFAGECLGVSDSFPVIVTGVPYFRDGVIGLEDIRISEESSIDQFNEYLEQFVSSELQQFFRYDTKAIVDTLAETVREQTSYDVKVTGFNISKIHAGSKAVRCKVRFVLSLN